jgi:tRNA-specific 2-thiouridylase
VVCNKEIKFDLLFKLLKKEKADYVATGHYARIKYVIASEAKQSRVSSYNSRLLRRYAPRNDKFKLCEAKDKSKDQSYFLYKLTQKELAKIIFPLGELKKIDVKKMAKKLKLPIVREESQDVCFLEGKTVEKFLEKRLIWERGRIKETGGKCLGLHRGLPFYTLGQRKGIRIGPPASRQEREAIRASGQGPFYVISKNKKKNELIVSNDPKKLLTNKFEVNQANWGDKGIKFPLSAKVQIRYHSERISAIIRKGKLGRFIVELKKPARAVTPGQSAVFYKNGEVLGGGTIKSKR